MTNHFDGQDFLSFSRHHEWSIEQAFNFSLDNGTQVEVWDTGVIAFTPAQVTTCDVILSSGIHGNETAPIEICNDFINQILDGTLELATRVLFIFGNPASMNIGLRFVQENMNRLFNGAHSMPSGLTNHERIRAKKLEQYVARFYQGQPESNERIHYDLHTAIRGSKNEKFAVYPFLHGEKHNTRQLQILAACGVSTILLSNAPTTTFSYFSSINFAAHAFTVELGKVRPFGENDMTRFIEVKQTLKAMLSGQDMQLIDYCEQDFNLFKVCRAIDKHHDDFEFHFADDVVNFTSFPIGFKLATQGELEYKVEHKGEAIVFPNANVANGNRAVLMVVPTSL